MASSNEIPHEYSAFANTVSPLDWNNLEPVIAQHRALISGQVKLDTRKLDSFEAFVKATSLTTPSSKSVDGQHSLREFAAARRGFLLNYKEATKSN